MDKSVLLIIIRIHANNKNLVAMFMKSAARWGY